MTIDPYEVLGVPAAATPAEIKDAYRSKAKTLHPDAGGDAEAFQALGLAYRVLSDPERRRKFDETGSLDDAADRTRAFALQMIHKAISGFMGDDGAIYRDLVAEARQMIAAEVRAAPEQMAQITRNVEKAERLRKRFKARKGPDFIGEMIEAQIVGARAGLKQVAERVAVANVALEMLADAEFTVEPQPVYARPMTNIFGSSLGGVGGGYRPLGSR